MLASHCDGRQFYFIGDWAGVEPPLPSEPGALDLFCPQHQPVAAEQIPSVALPTRAATFLLLPLDRRIADALRRCYPSAQIDSRYSREGRLLFTTVDAPAADLAAGRSCVIPDAVDLSARPPLMR